MADLQSCYFCASPDDVGEYAVVPPRLGGGDRSVALCPDCKTKLLRVMDPLIERAEQGPAGADDSEAGAGDPAPGAADGVANAEDTEPESDDGITMGTESSTEPETATSSAEPAASDGSPSAPSTPASGDDTPPQYDRAMRMLSNREFPIPRTEVESMLAGAYDLEREEVDAVIEHAVEAGRLAEENGQLREP